MSKITISLPEELEEQVRKDAAREGLTVSAWIAEAIRKASRRERMREAIEWYEAEHGKFTEGDIASVDRWIERGQEQWRRSHSTPES